MAGGVVQIGGWMGGSLYLMRIQPYQLPFKLEMNVKITLKNYGKCSKLVNY